MFYELDAQTTDGYEIIENKPVFFDRVECTGAEQYLNECVSIPSSGKCSSAGVTCQKLKTGIYLIDK